MCKEIIPLFLCVAILLSFTLPEIFDSTIREFIYRLQDTTTVVSGTHIACEIVAVSNPGYGVYTIYGVSNIIVRFPFIISAVQRHLIILHIIILDKVLRSINSQYHSKM